MIQLKHLGRFYPLAKGKFFYVLREINLEANEGDFVSIKSESAIINSPTSLSLGWDALRMLGAYMVRYLFVTCGFSIGETENLGSRFLLDRAPETDHLEPF